MPYIDLHTHTTASDGTFTPSALVDYAISKNLAAIAITDHDTVDGLAPAKNHLGLNTSLEIISGIEFSTNAPYLKSDIHILGLYIDETDPHFTHALLDIVNSRNERNLKMVEKLCDIGLKITMEDVIRNSTNGIITRAHFGKALLQKGYIKNLSEAFTKYIGTGCVGFIPRRKLSPEKAIQMIVDCGGIAVLAHPTLYHLNLRELDSLIQELVKSGLKGIEGIYSLYNKSEINYLQDFANQYGLLITGGSDFHGNNKVGIDLGVGRGQLKTPYELLDPIKKECNRV